MRAVIPADTVLTLCAMTRTNGLVLSAQQGSGDHLVRVFTTFLAGNENNATGGAVLGVGHLAALDGVRGDVTVVQGPSSTDRQGHFRLHINDSGDVLLGGTVDSLMTNGVILP